MRRQEVAKMKRQGEMLQKQMEEHRRINKSEAMTAAEKQVGMMRRMVMRRRSSTSSSSKRRMGGGGNDDVDDDDRMVYSGVSVSHEGVPMWLTPGPCVLQMNAKLLRRLQEDSSLMAKIQVRITFIWIATPIDLVLNTTTGLSSKVSTRAAASRASRYSAYRCFSSLVETWTT
jgi:hypothetical protein